MSSQGIHRFLQMRVGISHYRRLAQAKTITLKLKQDLPMQIDGEAWTENSKTIKIDSLLPILSCVGKNTPTRGVSVV